jgi:deazaflavin-dependent oxidoreductase (nitroreductase family)
MSDFNSRIIEEFRSNGGKVGGQFEGAPLLLLTSAGAKSGATRVNPMMYLPDGKRLYVFASKGGAPTNPDWYHNLAANPDTTIEVGTGTVKVSAREAGPDERGPIWEKQKETYPQFAGYEETSRGRQIPVVLLDPEA